MKKEPIYRKDYKAPEYTITDVKLSFDIYEDYTQVTNISNIQRKDCEARKLILNGEKLELISVEIDNVVLSKKEYEVNDISLILPADKSEFEIKIITLTKPHENLELDGLYKSDDIFCTQNEPEGFRKITYFLDRSDVMAKYKTYISADKKFKYLLANGNQIDKGKLENNRHFAVWEDPFPKPSYLFALVAGDFGVSEDEFITKSGRTISLKIFVDKGNESKTEHAMESLKKSMKWDEDTFNLECDLDTYMIVAVNSFNFGAMENKGLNVFNSKYVLADYASATDADFMGIEAVIAHEYFHNWTGNRITCRDWFQLTLKEGLTVFRDQEFSSDMNNRTIERINNVASLKSFQFAEDAGPMSHSIRPDSYIEINNFYTSTVYNKGAEVIRMIYVMLGKETFCKGITKYFELYDGQAVTTDDFIYAMEQVSDIDLTQFKSWYSQKGTPVITITDTFDDESCEYILTVKQPRIEGQIPFVCPFRLALFSENGWEHFALNLTIDKYKNVFSFKGLNNKPIPSLFRSFSAPVKVKYEYSTEELILLINNDTDYFNRYEASQKLFLNIINDFIQKVKNDEMIVIEDNVLTTYGKIIESKEIPSILKTKLLSIPDLEVIVDEMEICDYDIAFNVREFVIKSIGLSHENLFMKTYIENMNYGEYLITPEEIGKRALKSMCLSFLTSLGTSYSQLALEQFNRSNNMTDKISALSALCNANSAEKIEALSKFYDEWKDNSLVLNKYFAVQAMAKAGNVLQTVKNLSADSAFDGKNPNAIMSLFNTFTRNATKFHCESGQGYKFIKEKILEIDKFNACSAASLAKAFKKYKKLDEKRQALMKIELEEIVNTKGISSDLYEIVSKTLAGTPAASRQ